MLAMAASAAIAGDRLSPHTTILGVRLTDHTFADAFGQLGRAEMKHNGGNAAASATASCFVASDGTTLVLLSSTEMGGGWLTSFQLLQGRALADFSGDAGGEYEVPESAQPHCAPLAILSRRVSTAGGLRLGLRRSAVLDLLGKPCEPTGEEAARVRFCSVENVRATPGQEEHLRRIWGDGDYDVYSAHRWIGVEFAKGRVVAIRITQEYSGPSSKAPAPE